MFNIYLKILFCFYLFWLLAHRTNSISVNSLLVITFEYTYNLQGPISKFANPIDISLAVNGKRVLSIPEKKNTVRHTGTGVKFTQN